MSHYHIKTNRTFHLVRKYGYLYTLLVTIGGIWYPKLGLSVIVVMLGLMLFSFFKGRYWCGNVCGHGSLYDTLLLPFSRNAAIPRLFRSPWFIGAFFLWFMFNFTSRQVAVFVEHSADTVAFWDGIGAAFVFTYFMVAVISTSLGLTFSPRTWCHFCPMGTMQTALYKLGRKSGITRYTDEKISIVNLDACHKCGKCARVCPMQLKPYLEFSDKGQLDNPACIRCSTCVENCPAGQLTLATERTMEKLRAAAPVPGAEDRRRIETSISRIRYLKDDVREYTFEFASPQQVQYRAGQFILVRIQAEPEEMFRAYSISSYNQDGRSLSVTVKKAQDGYGSELIYQNFKQGDPVVLEGPLGHELLVDPDARKVLLVAGGIGITPFLAVVTDLLRNRHNLEKVILLYGVNQASELLYQDEFAALAAESDKFELVSVVAFDDAWTGERGFVTDYLPKIPDLVDYKVYMCGPPPMVNATTENLLALGLDRKQIQSESA